MPRQGKPDLVVSGDVFYYLTVIRFSHQDKRWRRHYLCKCRCGVQKTVQGTLLRSGNTKSCGCTRTYTKFSNNHGAIIQIILQMKRHAEGRGLLWELDFSFVDKAVRLPCTYCGDPGSNTFRNKNCLEGFQYNGLDRVDSTLGYIKGNVVPCCRICNLAKRDLTLAEFRAWVLRLTGMAEQWG